MTKEREPWNYNEDGTEKIYKPDKEHMKCPQSDFCDEYGTPEEIYNAYCYYNDKVKEGTDLFSNSITLLLGIQRGLSKEKTKHLIIEKPKARYINDEMRELAEPQELANMVHHYIDWLRATVKRTWDNRGLNPKKGMFDACFKGMYVNHATLLHYHENPERH